MKKVDFTIETFIANSCKHTPIPIGNREDYIRVKQEELKELQSYFDDSFINDLHPWVQEVYKTVSPDDLRPKCYEIKNVGRIFLHQRFKNGHREFPFVLVMVDFEDSSFYQYFNTICDQVKHDYKWLQPLGVSYHPKFLKDISYQYEVWNQTLYGRFKGQVEDIERFDLKISLEPLNYDFYMSEYQKWEKQHSDLSRFVSPESEEVLAEAARNSLYYKFYVDKKLAGIICGEREIFYGHSGVYIIEEFLFEEFRGQGLAKKMQQLFHLSLPDEVKYIWGHIMKENLPSFYTAIACDRKIVEQELFFPFGESNE